MADANMFGPIDVAISGMRTFNRSMGHIYTNIANARTVDAGNGEPYRRVEALIKQQSQEDFSGVEIDKVAPDMSPFQEVYEPGHHRKSQNDEQLLLLHVNRRIYL